MEFQNKAIEILKAGATQKMQNRYADAMKREVSESLQDFCRQDEEFAQAVVQGGSFEKCMEAVAKCVHGNSISDMEAYGAAVRFYFPGAGIDVKMTIDLCASVRDKDAAPEAEKKGVVVDLSDFF